MNYTEFVRRFALRRNNATLEALWGLYEALQATRSIVGGHVATPSACALTRHSDAQP
jgi:hypothetical protein